MMAAACACTQDSKVTCSSPHKVFRLHIGSICADKSAAIPYASCRRHQNRSTPVMSHAVSRKAGSASAQASHFQSPQLN